MVAACSFFRDLQSVLRLVILRQFTGNRGLVSMISLILSAGLLMFSFRFLFLHNILSALIGSCALES